MRISDWSSDVCSSDLLRREGAGFGELAFDQGACGDGGGVENAVRVDIGGGVPEADLAVRAAREDDGKFLREGDEAFQYGALAADGVPCADRVAGGGKARLPLAVIAHAEIGRASSRERVSQYE